MISTLDLSVVTDRLVDLVDNAIKNSPVHVANPFNYKVSGSMPEEVRKEGDCAVSVYLMHLQPEPYTRNMPLTGDMKRPHTNATQPLGLTLFYLVTAHSKDNSQQEQQSMSIAIKAFHENAMMEYTDPKTRDGFHCTITLRSEDMEEANRRWQTYMSPFRLSAVYRVSVVFLTPQDDKSKTAAPPQTIGLGVTPAALP